MAEELRIVPIAHIRTDFPTKFGIPRQAGIADALQGTVVFEPEFRVDDALRGIEGFSHLWLIWGFSENAGSSWTPTVRPPRLGGNVRMGVFATRSPFRPNGLGLSCVRLLSLAAGGFAPDEGRVLAVDFPEQLLNAVPEEKRAGLLSVLAHDPRPRYQDDPERIYGMAFAGLDIRFRVEDTNLIITDVINQNQGA